MKAKAEEMTKLKCSECGEEIYTCFGCGGYFELGETIICSMKHRCEVCG